MGSRDKAKCSGRAEVIHTTKKKGKFKIKCNTWEKEACWFLSAIGFIRALICSHASKTAAPYISELAEAAVGDEFGTWANKKNTLKEY